MKAFLLFAIATLSVAVSGCNTLSKVKSELGKGGFALWYPAEADVQPGQIWVLDGKKKTQGWYTPANITPKTAQVQFETLTQEVKADVSLNADFAAGTLGQAGDLKALLEAGTVKKVDLNFGKTKVQRVSIDDFTDPAKLGNFPTQYRTALERVRQRQPGYVLLSAVVQTSGMKYKFQVENRASLEGKTAGAIEQLLGAGAKITFESDTQATLNIEDGQTLAIGFALMDPKFLDPGFGAEEQLEGLSDEEIIRRMSLSPLGFDAE